MANAKVHINAQEGNRLETIKAHSGKTAKGSHSIQLVLPTPKSFLIALRFAARRPFDSLLCSSSRGQALRRKEKGFSFHLPSIYEPACAQKRAHADSTLRFAQGQA